MSELADTILSVIMVVAPTVGYFDQVKFASLKIGHVI
jgi:hypothetical protein